MGDSKDRTIKVLAATCCGLALALLGTLTSFKGAEVPRASRRLQQVTASSDATNSTGMLMCPIWNDPCQATLQADRPASCHGAPNMYTELTVQELEAVRDYLFTVPELDITPSDSAAPTDNFIFSIFLETPKKADALAYLDGNGTMPTRAASVVLLLGKSKVVKHVKVWPVDQPSNWTFTPIHRNIMEVPWIQRPLNGPETILMNSLLDTALTTMNPFFLKEWSGWHWCAEDEDSDLCLTINFQSPGSTDIGKRGSWIYLLRGGEGYYDKAIGHVEFFFNSSDPDHTKWAIDTIWYDGKLFSSADDFMKAYKAKKIKVITPPLPKNASDDLYATFKQRPNPRNPSQPLGPLIYDPQGRRFTITNRNKIEWMGWSLFAGNHPLYGTRVHDVHFKGERIAYEVAVNEAMAGYGAMDPVQGLTLYLDSHWGLGASVKEMMHGVDCPSNAAYLDYAYTYGGDGPAYVRNAFCVFEMPTGKPILRHYENDGVGGFTSWGAVKESVLVIRGMHTVSNYDYMVDLVLHLDGALEMTTSTSGYVQGVNWKKGKEFATPLWRDISGTLHDHTLLWKVDLDILGTQNSVQMHEIKPQVLHNTVMGKRVVNKRVDSSFLELEKPFEFQFKKPVIFTVVNEKETNKWGSLRGYSLKVDRPIYQLTSDPELNAPYSKATAFSKYWMSVSRQHDDEPIGSSIYHQMNPQQGAVVDFDALFDGESVRNQDLVIWFTSGLFHVPSADDAPVTGVTGNNIGFIVRPYNYGEEHGATDLPDMSVIYPNEAGIKRPPAQEFLYGSNNCMPKVDRVEYNGSYSDLSGYRYYKGR